LVHPTVRHFDLHYWAQHPNGKYNTTIGGLRYASMSKSMGSMGSNPMVVVKDVPSWKERVPQLDGLSIGMKRVFLDKIGTRGEDLKQLGQYISPYTFLPHRPFRYERVK
jgi:hypothetical protein